MKILFVSALLPYPLYSGGQVRIYNLLKLLGKKHDITLLSFIRREDETRYLKKLPFCRRVRVVMRGHAWQPGYVVRAIVGKYPLLLTTYANSQMRRTIEEELENVRYDLVHIEPGYVWPSLPLRHPKLVVAEHNIESSVYDGYVRRFPLPPLRPFLHADVAKLSFWEKHIWSCARHIVVVSPDDASAILKTVPRQLVTVIPNGVDLPSYPFRPKKLGSPPVFLFVGSFLWMQNRDAVWHLVVDIWPRIRECYPKATLRIVGRHMPADLRRTVSSQAALLLESVSDIGEELAHADVLLAPIRVGGGTSFKILEAMASGVAVVTTTLGAKGLDVRHGQELLIADSVQATIEAVRRLVADRKRYNDVVKLARRLIETHYSWSHIAEKLEEVWEKTCEENH